MVLHKQEWCFVPSQFGRAVLRRSYQISDTDHSPILIDERIFVIETLRRLSDEVRLEDPREERAPLNRPQRLTAWLNPP